MKQKIPIDIVNATTLANYVSANMGLEVSPKLGVLGIKAKMAQAGFPTDFIEIDDGREEPEIIRIEPPTKARQVDGKRSVQLRIEPQERPGGNEPVFVSVNGVHMLIPRAQTCWVEHKYYEALIHAVSKVAIVDENLNVVGWREVPEYPVSVFMIEDPLPKAPVQEQAA
jgi:hypothetical protein